MPTITKQDDGSTSAYFP